MAVHKEWKEVLKYAESIRDGKKIACHDLKLTVERFFQDLENPAYEIDHIAPEFCIRIIERTLKHQQGENLQGEPMRGKPFLLQPFQKFIEMRSTVVNFVPYIRKLVCRYLSKSKSAGKGSASTSRISGRLIIRSTRKVPTLFPLSNTPTI